MIRSCWFIRYCWARSQVIRRSRSAGSKPTIPHFKFQNFRARASPFFTSTSVNLLKRSSDRKVNDSTNAHIPTCRKWQLAHSVRTFADHIHSNRSQLSEYYRGTNLSFSLSRQLDTILGIIVCWGLSKTPWQASVQKTRSFSCDISNILIQSISPYSPSSSSYLLCVYSLHHRCSNNVGCSLSQVSCCSSKSRCILT